MTEIVNIIQNKKQNLWREIQIVYLMLGGQKNTWNSQKETFITDQMLSRNFEIDRKWDGHRKYDKKK